MGNKNSKNYLCLLSVLNVFTNVHLLELGHNNLFGIVSGLIWNTSDLLGKNKNWFWYKEIFYQFLI